MGRQGVSGRAPAAGLAGVVGSRATTARRSLRPRPTLCQAQLRLLGVAVLRSLWLLIRGRDQEAALRLLPLHRLQAEVPGAIHTRGGTRGAVRWAPRGH